MTGRATSTPARCAILLSSIATLGLSACATSGTGTAVAQKAGQPPQNIVFTWDAGRGPTEGTIQTALPDGEEFQGVYVQITSDTNVESISPFYQRWYGGWGYGWDSMWWPGPYDDDVYSYVTVYTGRVLATLRSPEGNTMRCQFRLADPRDGLAGGGIGECKTSEGTHIESAIFSEENVRRG